jgi:hypothetical protein
MVIIHLSRKIPVFNEFRTRDNPGASLTEVIGEKIGFNIFRFPIISYT